MYDNAYRLNRKKYALCAAIPGIAMAVITFWAGYLQVKTIYLPNEQYLLAGLAVLAMLLMGIVFVGTFRKWYTLFKIKTSVTDSYGEEVKELVER